MRKNFEQFSPKARNKACVYAFTTSTWQCREVLVRDKRQFKKKKCMCVCVCVRMHVQEREQEIKKIKNSIYSKMK